MASHLLMDSEAERPTVLSDLPLVVIDKIFAYLSYEEMSHVRRTCKFIQKHAERTLNEGFFQFGRQVALSSANLKRQLPKKESERRIHPLNRYAEVYSALETRYTLLTMTYRKYIDQRLCCFIPGKVLDVAFSVMRQVNNYLAVNAPAVVAFDMISILRDIRDYSSMAMEHFDEHVAPRLPIRSLMPLFKANPTSISSFSNIFGRPPPTLTRRSEEHSQSLYLTKSNEEHDYAEELCNNLRNEMRGKLEEHNRVIEEQRRLIREQGAFIRQIVSFLGEMSKQNDWTPHLMDNFHRLSSQYVCENGPSEDVKLVKIKGRDSDMSSCSKSVDKNPPNPNAKKTRAVKRKCFEPVSEPTVRKRPNKNQLVPTTTIKLEQNATPTIESEDQSLNCESAPLKRYYLRSFK